MLCGGQNATIGLQRLTTKGSTILGVDGQTLAIQGVAWHGFDNTTYLDGLLRVHNIHHSQTACTMQDYVHIKSISGSFLLCDMVM